MGKDDRSLVQAAREGKAEAFEELFVRYRERVFRIAYRYTRDKERSLDLCQDTFVKAFQSLGNFRSDSTFYTWLFRITYNTCIDYLRSKAARKELSVELNEELLDREALPQMRRSVEPRPEAAASEAELRRELEKALTQLPEAQRSVFLLHVKENLPYKDIAEVMGCSVGTVMSRLFYARQKLQEMLRGHLGVSP